MWPALIPVVTGLLDKLLPDPQAAAEAKLKALDMAQKGELAALDADMRLALGQLEVNKIEAGTDLFRGGWRPAVGWTCAGGLFYQIIARPLLGWAASNLWGWNMPPSLEMETLLTLLFGMLGLGAYRTAEKIRGVAG
jgi:roadblock/LC7 domain-containing protein